MGLTHVNGTVSSSTLSDQAVTFLVDSGASYSLLPKSVWSRLNLTPDELFECILADGQRIFRPMSECKISVLGKSRTTPVILGEEDDEALLGVISLEQMGFVLDPFKRKLLPMRARI